MDRPSIRQLECLVAVADHGSFRKAATALGISQPALSAQVQGAEDLLGVQVFERDRRSVLVTPAGEDIVGRARASRSRRSTRSAMPHAAAASRSSARFASA